MVVCLIGRESSEPHYILSTWVAMFHISPKLRFYPSYFYIISKLDERLCIDVISGIKVSRCVHCICLWSSSLVTWVIWLIRMLIYFLQYCVCKFLKKSKNIFNFLFFIFFYRFLSISSANPYETFLVYLG